MQLLHVSQLPPLRKVWALKCFSMPCDHDIALLWNTSSQLFQLACFSLKKAFTKSCPCEMGNEPLFHSKPGCASPEPGLLLCTCPGEMRYLHPLRVYHHHWPYYSLCRASSAAYNFSHWKGLILFGVQDAKPLLLALLNVLDASASFWRIYTETLKTASPVERWISILQSFAVSCDHTNSSYAKTSSDCCNDSLGQGRDHMLKSLTENSCI